MARSKRIHIDIETYSELNIKDTGPYRQVEHPSTEIIFVGYKIHNAPPKIWWSCVRGSTMPDDLREALDDSSYELAAHNASYERIMLSGPPGKKLGFKERWLGWSRWVCTMAKALMVGLPASLEKCADALSLEQRKDTKGKMAMLAITKPDKKGKRVLRSHSPEKYKITAQYCLQDVEVEYAIDKYLPDLTPFERYQVWVLDKEINQRGIQVDMPVVKKIHEFAELYKAELTADFVARTGLKPTQNVKLVEYFNTNFNLGIDNVRKSTLEDAYKASEKGSELSEILGIKMSLSKASTSKYSKILKVACKDDRLRGMLEYHKAATGRWAGKIVQMQNLTKETHTLQQGQIIRMLKSSNYEEFRLLYPDVYEAFKRCLRGVFVAKRGHRFAIADLSQIEARVILWLAGDYAGLQAFADGIDMYKREACGVYEAMEGRKYTLEEITKEMRTIGKVASLALGFQGGAGAFLSMAEIYGVVVDEKTANIIKNAWRKANPKIVNMWSDLENACIRAIETGQPQRSSRCLIQKVKEYLVIQLPSGRRLFYFRPSTYMATVKYKKEGKDASFTKLAIKYWGVKSVDGGATKYQEITTHGGKLTENITQACARDKIAFDMLNMKKAGHNIVLTVHDEIIIEEKDKNSLTIDPYNDIMRIPPEWMSDMPLDADGFCGRRYNK
jgi:DNA polymerase